MGMAEADIGVEPPPSAPLADPARLRPATGSRGRRLRLLVLTTLYPSRARPRHGIFVENRLRRIVADGDIEARVVAPVPWFPLRGAAFGRYGEMAATPRAERRFDIPVAYPRFVVIPKVGMSLQPPALAAAALRAVRQCIAEGFEPDLVDAHFFYPDGVAAARVARALGKPLIVSARGSDINLFGGFPAALQAMRGAAAQAAGLIAVSAALKQRMVELGMDAARIRVLRNGVDLAQFAPQSQAQARARFGLAAGPVVAVVGNLLPEKGVDLVIDAVAACRRGASLLVVGAGPERAGLERRAAERGLGERVRFTGNLPQAELSWAYSAADVLALGSQREGWPNVLLEAMACGTPVVATDVGGVREIVTEPLAGAVVAERSALAFARALDGVLAQAPAREAVRAYAARFGWEPVVRAQRELYFAAAGR